MHLPQPLEFLNFESKKNPLIENKCQLQQVKYLVGYLKGLNVKTILIEPNYFDRDYLSEFSAFYSTSVYGYKNTCQRLHFFSNQCKEFFKKATGGDKSAIKNLNNHYLGFCVLRPIQTCLGKTVLKWYSNKETYSHRVIVKRKYTCHVAGVELNVEGLAWQQQDTGVGACATIALWSALQSSAFDDFHAIPTTAEITKSANITTSFGSRPFPSKGLNKFQLCEAIKELGLSPMVQDGDIRSHQLAYFTKARLMNAIASYIRSGYPVLILGELKIDNNSVGGGHAVCAVGFRNSNLSDSLSSKTITLEDSLNQILYIHDDNIGPNARFKIIEQKNHYAVLHLEPPSYSSFKEINNYQIIPHSLVVATHNELRASPNQLYQIGLKNIDPLSSVFQNTSIQLSLGVRFIKLTDYIHNELERLLENPDQLGQIRLSLWENLPPLSLHLGLVRIGLVGQFMPLLDILYDTTDSNLRRFGYLSYNSKFDEIITKYQFDFGIKI